MAAKMAGHFFFWKTEFFLPQGADVFAHTKNVVPITLSCTISEIFGILYFYH